MKNQLNVTIRAVLAAKQEIAQLKQELECSDVRLGAVEDAEMGAEWIVKRLRELEPFIGAELSERVSAATASR
jgi:predicted oxidoreductase